MRKLVCTLLILAAVLHGYAQDPNFSQFFVSPLTLNPALTGKFDGTLRLAGNFRNQWPTINNAFVTGTFPADAGILRNRIPEFDQFGVGAMIFKDESGNGVLSNTFLALSTAYHKSLDENGYHQLGLGFQGTYVSKSLDTRKVFFMDQLRANGWTGTTNESLAQRLINVNYFDMNLGVFYNGTSNGENNYYVGASMYHVGRPKESFADGNFILDPRLTIQAGGMLPLDNGNAVHLSGIHSRQANAVNTQLGGAYMASVNNDPSNPTNLYLGLWYRVKDAFIPYVGLEFGDFRFGASYDVNTSTLKPASNMRGGVEFSLIYVKKHSDPNVKNLNCPKF